MQPILIELPKELSDILREDPDRLNEVLGIIADFYLETEEREDVVLN